MEAVIEVAPLPSVAGFTFKTAGRIAKIDKLVFQPAQPDVDELLALILRVGVPCKTDMLRCDNQGTTSGGYANTQCQLGGGDDYVARSDPSKQSTSFTQVNISPRAFNHPLAGQALRDAHDYSYRTRNVVTVELAQGTASVGVDRSSVASKTLACSACKFRKTLPGTATVEIPAKCPQCKKAGTVSLT